ncbi:MAG: hypothetical protein HND47_17900 [Chloroflexi bacterium]|nr:hypothetical protein [Chloroflexota bacterium]
MDVGDPNKIENLTYSLFDYDVSIIHIEKPRNHTIGYYHNIPKISEDARTAIENGRTVICIPESSNFTARSGNEYGATVYDWLKNFHIELRDNIGHDIRPSGSGMSQPVKNYLRHCSEYHQIVLSSETEKARQLAVVGDTDIVVGMEFQISKGVFVILPPPSIQKDSYQNIMYDIEHLARRYFERAQRRIPVIDAPDWLSGYLVKRAAELGSQIEKLREEKSVFDRIAYVLYGSGDELEECVALLLEHIGLKVDRQPRGANIDLKANNAKLGVRFAIEVTGTKGIIRKDSNKISQVWQHIHEIQGTEGTKDKIVIVANTECHLPPNQRSQTSFSSNVVDLLERNEVLLISTLQLYTLWKAIFDGVKNVEDVILHLYEISGLYKE